MTEVHQFLPSFGYRDAVGNHTVATQRALAGRGVKGGIWAEDIHPEMSARAKLYTRYERTRSARRGGNILLYQGSTGSAGMSDLLRGRRERKAIYYHNITPSAFFEPYDAGAAVNLSRGLEEIKVMAAEVAVAMANSRFSATNLEELGARDVRVIPPYLAESMDARPSSSLVDWLRRTKKGTDVLFVSRVAPHKGHLHLLRAFAALRAAVDPGARLFVVGAWGPEAYMDAIFRLRDKLGADGVAFTGSITDSHLSAFYQECDVYLSLSEHEGYGLPIVEAMRRGIPVVAYDAAAVGETMGAAGVLVRTLDPLVLAEVLGKVATDDALREQVVARQHERVREIEVVDRDGLIVQAFGGTLT